MARKFERFKEIKVIGAGAFGKTLLVEDLTQAGRRVVIKMPLTEETETATTPIAKQPQGNGPRQYRPLPGIRQA